MGVEIALAVVIVVGVWMMAGVVADWHDMRQPFPTRPNYALIQQLEKELLGEIFTINPKHPVKDVSVARRLRVTQHSAGPRLRR